MDQIAIFADIHSNLPALETVLADIRQRGIETIYCLGDLIGKGPDSCERAGYFVRPPAIWSGRTTIIVM